MPGSANIDPAVLVDGLLGTVDSLRDLQRQFGQRPYRLYRVARTWSGDLVGEGAPTDVLTEITPRPQVAPFSESLTNRLEACGLQEAGLVKLTEVSLTYTFEEIAGAADLAANAEHLLMLREGYGQAQPDRYFRCDRPPFPDREKSMGWVVWLRLQQTVDTPAQIATLNAAELVLAPQELEAA